jgi:hypothetical protein
MRTQLALSLDTCTGLIALSLDGLSIHHVHEAATFAVAHDVFWLEDVNEFFTDLDSKVCLAFDVHAETEQEAATLAVPGDVLALGGDSALFSFRHANLKGI